MHHSFQPSTHTMFLFVLYIIWVLIWMFNASYLPVINTHNVLIWSINYFSPDLHVKHTIASGHLHTQFLHLCWIYYASPNLPVKCKIASSHLYTQCPHLCYTLFEAWFACLMQHNFLSSTHTRFSFVLYIIWVLICMFNAS